MKPRKKMSRKSLSSGEPNRISVFPILILLFLIVFLITKITSYDPSKRVEDSMVKVPAISPTLPQKVNPTTVENLSNVNHHPVFVTIQLPVAKMNVPYSTVLTAEDIDVNDNLTMVINNLPNGIGYTCSWGPQNNKKLINCLVSGIPTYTYIGDVIATVKDDKGGSAVNKFIFQVIQPTPTPAPSNFPTSTPPPAYLYPTWTPTP